MNDANKLLSRPLLAVSLSLALAVGSAHAQAPAPAAPLTIAQVKAMLGEQGYTKVDDLKFDDGLWKAKATSGDGKRGEVRIGAQGGRIYAEGARSKLSEAEVVASLTSQSYSRVHDVKYEDGLWEAKAQTSSGQKQQVYADPMDGRVVSAQND